MKPVYLMGLGAVGAAYASILHQMDKHAVKVILDQERIRRYSENGFIINGKRYDFDFVAPQEASEKADLIIIAVKGHHLEEAMAGIEPFVGDNTVILSLLNGISSEEILAQRFGWDKLLHAFCVGTDALRIETTVTFKSPGKIVLGDKSKVQTDKVKAVQDLFERARLPYSIPDDILKAMWWKFLMNVGINQVSAVLKAPYGIFKTVPEARALLKDASNEVIPLAQKEGIALTEQDISSYIDVIDTLAPEGKTSMLQDVEAKRKTEVESFALTVMNLGKKHGIPTPVNDLLYKMITALEKSYFTFA